jgi:hypothetical protein
MLKKSEKILTREKYNNSKSYQKVADEAKVTKRTAMKIIQKQHHEFPTLSEITKLKLQQGYYQHPFILNVDSTSGRTIEGMDTILLIAVLQFLDCETVKLKKEVVISKLLYNERADTIVQVLKAELLDIGLNLDERDVIIFDAAKELRKAIPEVFKKAKIQGCLVHLKRLMDEKLFSTSDTAKEWLDEITIAKRDEFKRLIMAIARAKTQTDRSCTISKLEGRLLSVDMSEFRGFWKRLKKDLDADFYHTLDEQPFNDIFHKCGEDIRDNNVAEAECHGVQRLRKGSNCFKKFETTQDRFNFVNGRKRLTKKEAKQLKRTIPEFEPIYCFSIPLPLAAVDLADTTFTTKMYQTPKTEIEKAEERYHRVPVKNFSFFPSALPSFARELQGALEDLYTKLNIPHTAEEFEDPLRKHHFPTLDPQVVTEEKTMQIFRGTFDKLQEITRRHCGNYVVQPYKTAVEVLEAVTGVKLKPQYQLLLSQGLISNNCPRKWNYARKRLKLQVQLEKQQNVEGVEFHENGAIAYITDPTTQAAKMLIHSAGLDKPSIPEKVHFLVVNELRRNRRFTGHDRVKIEGGIYDSELLGLLVKSFNTADVLNLDGTKASLHQGGENMPLGIKINGSMIVVAPTLISGTNAKKVIEETPTLTDLEDNNTYKMNWKTRPKFDLRQFAAWRSKPPKREQTPSQLTLEGVPCTVQPSRNTVDKNKNYSR